MILTSVTAGQQRPSTFVAAGYCSTALMAGTNIATPLYGVYGRLFGLTPFWVSVTFTEYCVALVPTLLYSGLITTRLGTRRVVILGVGAAAVATLLLGYPGTIADVCAARLLQAVAVGMCSGPLAACLARYPGRSSSSVASATPSLVVCIGVGLGPPLGGMSELFDDAPLRLPYLVELALLLGALLAAVNLPARVGEGRGTLRPSRATLSLDPWLSLADRAQLLSATWTSSLAWSAAALFLTFMPTYVLRVSGSSSILLQGIVSGALFIVSGIAQLLMRGWDYEVDKTCGLILTGVGAGLLMLAYWIWWPVLFTAVAAAGFGLGFSFRGGMRHVNAIADEFHRVSVVSFLYVGIYLAEGASVLAVGVIASTGGSVPAVLTGMGAIAVSCLATAVPAGLRRST